MFKNNKFLWILFIIVCVPLACSIYFMRVQEKEFDKLGNSIISIRAVVDQLQRERAEKENMNVDDEISHIQKD